VSQRDVYLVYAIRKKEKEKGKGAYCPLGRLAHNDFK